MGLISCGLLSCRKIISRHDDSVPLTLLIMIANCYFSICRSIYSAEATIHSCPNHNGPLAFSYFIIIYNINSNVSQSTECAIWWTRATRIPWTCFTRLSMRSRFIARLDHWGFVSFGGTLCGVAKILMDGPTVGESTSGTSAGEGTRLS